MSDERYREKTVKEFLDEIKEKLPFWLKNNEDELKEVISELEEHIEDKTEALEETGKSRLEATQLAITQMGSPSTIAREYKRRGTPKLFITEELFPTYLTVLKYAGLAIGLITAIVTLMRVIITGISGGKWWAVIFESLQRLTITSILVAAGISVIFVWLSYEGYFPEDLKNVFKLKTKLKAEAQQPPKVRIEKPAVKKPKKEYPKRLDKPHNLIIGGIVALVWGVIAVWQPFPEWTPMIDPQFLLWVRVIGFTWIFLGIVGIVHGIFVSWSYDANKALYPLRAILNLISIPIIVLFLMNPQLFPIPIWSESTGFQVLSIAPNFYWIYYLVFSLILIGTLVGAIQKFYKGIRLQEEDLFFEGEA
ncbi:MAG: hypothetical protein HWN66_11850 [Candidatus Helarchaeota archaeon]|nr:hypothetical protein [Candidatus Helarchaeota archaeon]